MNITRNSIISTVLFALLVATLMAFEEFYEGDMTAATAVEEILAYLSILGLMFVGIVAPFQRLINYLNQKYTWKGHHFQRLALEGFVVLLFSTVLGFVFGEFIHLYIDHVLEASSVVLRTILFLLITSSIIMALLELRLVQDEKEELVLLSQRLEKENIEHLYNSLKQQVNPHFLFNSLSVLSSLVHYDAKKADLFIQHFSDIYRYVLELNKENLVTLDQELQFLNSYLFLQRIRFGENIDIDFSIDDQYHSWNLPPLSIQLVFENILKHNIISKSQPISVSLLVREESLIIRNTFQPKPSSEGTGLGIPNLQEKYRLLNAKLPSFREENLFYTVALPIFPTKQV